MIFWRRLFILLLSILLLLSAALWLLPYYLPFLFNRYVKADFLLDSIGTLMPYKNHLQINSIKGRLANDNYQLFLSSSAVNLPYTLVHNSAAEGHEIEIDKLLFSLTRQGAALQAEALNKVSIFIDKNISLAKPVNFKVKSLNYDGLIPDILNLKPEIYILSADMSQRGSINIDFTLEAAPLVLDFPPIHLEQPVKVGLSGKSEDAVWYLNNSIDIGSNLHALSGSVVYKADSNQLSLNQKLRILSTDALLTEEMRNAFLPKNISFASGEVKADIRLESKAGKIDKSSVKADFTVSLPVVEYGLKFEKFKLDASLRGLAGRIALRALRASAALLDGIVEVKADSLIFNPFSLKNASLSMNRISLERLFEVYPSDRVSAKGAIKADLPFIIGEGGITIANGSFESLGQGIIKVDIGRYEDLADMDFAAQALSNFHYSSLSGKVNLTPEGIMLLNVKISGLNPEMNNRQTINVNVNIEENLWALLESIRLTRTLTGKVIN